jgi:hypothetical protein
MLNTQSSMNYPVLVPDRWCVGLAKLKATVSHKCPA